MILGDNQWYEQPSLILQIRALSKLREDLREKNLFEAHDIRPKDDLGEPTEQAKRARTADGTFNDLADPWMGASGTGFGRNAPLEKTITHTKKLLDPDPRLISRKLMARDSFKPAGIVNSFAAAWIQFENHNWFFHGNGEPDKVIDIPLREGDNFPQNPMQIRRTIPMNGREILDGEPAPHFRANFVLRAMVLPPGEHQLEFRFEPVVYYMGEKISFTSSAMLLLLIVTMAFFEVRKAWKQKA